MSDRQSSFIFYSYGIVAVDKERNEDRIKVVPIEEISMPNGTSEEIVAMSRGGGKPNAELKQKNNGKTLADQSMTYNVDLPDHQGVGRTDKVTGDLMIIAEWTPLAQSNRMTAPDVIRGETVMIFRVADTDEYYWNTMRREPNLRRQETVCYMFGNIPNGITAFDKDTSYWFEVSTHDKYVHLHTAKNDGEPFKYDVKIDTGRGNVILTDNAGNFIELDSPTGKLTVTTVEDVEVNTKRVVVNASESTIVNTVVAEVNASKSTTVNTDKAEINAGTSVKINTEDIMETGGNSSIHIRNDEITINTNLTRVKRHLRVEGNFHTRSEIGDNDLGIDIDSGQVIIRSTASVNVDSPEVKVVSDEVTMTVDGDTTINSVGNTSITSQGKIDLTCIGDINLISGEDVKITGPSITAIATGTMVAKANTLNVTSNSANINIAGSAQCNVGGNMGVDVGGGLWVYARGQDVNISAGDDIILTATGNVELTSGSEVRITGPNALVVGNESVTVMSKVVNVNASVELNMSAPAMKMTGALTVEGAIHSTGDMSSEGGVSGVGGLSTAGGISAGADITTTGNVIAGGTTLT